MKAPTDLFSSSDTSTIAQISRRFTRLPAWFITAWNYQSLSFSWTSLCLLVVLASICLARAYAGLTGTAAFSHDAFMLLDGAWRMLNGQRPHIDFYSHVGVLTYAPTIVGLWVAGGTVKGYGYAQALVGFLLGLWAYLLGRRRLREIPRILMCLAVVVLATAPFALGFPPLYISPATTYNRYGYVFLSLILVEALTECRPTRKNSDLLGGFSTGAIAAILLFLKITYFAAAIFVILTLIAARNQAKRRWAGLAIGFTGFSFLFCCYYGFNLKPMLHDLITVAGAKHIALRWYMLDSIFENAVVLMAIGVSASLLLLTQNRPRPAWKIFLATSTVTLTGILLIFGNCEQSGFPLAVFWAIILIQLVNVELADPLYSPEGFHASVILLAFAIVLSSLTSGGLSLTYSVFQKVRLNGHATALQTPLLGGFSPIKEDEWYSEFVNDGLSLVKKYSQRGDTLMSLDFSNPFSYSLHMKPAPGGTTVLQYKTTFNDQYRQSAENLFGAADLVMLPKTFSDGTLQESIPRLYGPYLERHFTLLGESSLWRIYRRNNEAQ